MFDFLGMASMMTEEKVEEKAPFYLKEVMPIKFIYRPQTWDEYIGQDNAKECAKLKINQIINYKPVHILLSGRAGGGKTSLVNLIGKYLQFDITYQIGETFTLDSLREFLIANESGKRPRMLFIDEIHGLKKAIAEFMYPILEDFILPTNGKTIRPFVMAGTTTDKYTMIKKYKPLVDRMAADIQLEDYTYADMEQIIRQYNQQIYKIEVPEATYFLLAQNVRRTPRIAISFFDDYVMCKDIFKVLKIHRIIKEGLTDIDIKVLRYLAETGKAAGEETLAIVGGVERANYRLIVEPYLIAEGYLAKTNKGRIILEKGNKLLEDLK
jgi:Holliday junction DNA helicase RuvB